MPNDSEERAVEVFYVLSLSTWILATVVTEDQHILSNKVLFETRNTIGYNH